jgi:hypothetical protein
MPRNRRVVSDTHEIRSRLIRLARLLSKRRAGVVQFTGDEKLDRKLNDLRRTPHLFVIGCVAD